MDLDLEQESKNLRNGLATSSFGKANNALVTLERHLGPENASTHFGLAVTRGCEALFSFFEDKPTKGDDADDIQRSMRTRIATQSRTVRLLSELAVTLAKDRPACLAQLTDCCLSMATNLIGAKKHIEWGENHSGESSSAAVTSAGKKCPHFYQVDTEQQCFLGALAIRERFAAHNIPLEETQERAFIKGIGEIFDFKAKKFTEFGEIAMLGSADHFLELTRGPGARAAEATEFLDRMATLAEALELGASIKRKPTAMESSTPRPKVSL